MNENIKVSWKLHDVTSCKLQLIIKPVLKQQKGHFIYNLSEFIFYTHLKFTIS